MAALFPSDRGAADRLFEASEWSQAREAYRALLEEAAEPGLRAALLCRIGRTHFMQGDLWTAEARFGDSLEEEPSPDAYFFAQKKGEAS